MDEALDRRSLVKITGATLGGVSAFGSVRGNETPTRESKTKSVSDAVVDVSVSAMGAYTTTDLLPVTFEPSVEVVAAAAVAVTKIPEGMTVDNIETESELAADPFDAYDPGDSKFQILFDRVGNHAIDFAIEVDERAAPDTERYKPVVHEFGVAATDDDGNEQSVTDTFGIRHGAPTIATYADASAGNQIDTDGLRKAIADWRSDEIDTELLRTVIEYWRSRDPVAFVDVVDQTIDGTGLTITAGSYVGHEWGAHVHFFDDEMGATIGVSEEFEAGEIVEEFTIEFDRLDEPVEEQQQFMVMLHTTDEQGGYADNDAVWVWVGDEPVTDVALVDVEDPD